MATIKNPLLRANPLPCLRTKTPLKSTFQQILPDILPSPVLQKNQTKKRVRFELKLEPIKDLPTTPDSEKKLPEPLTKPIEDLPTTPDLEKKLPEPLIKPIKQITDPWRTNGPLYGAYVEYLEKKDALTPDIAEINRPATPTPSLESATYVHTPSTEPPIYTRTPSIEPSIHTRTPSIEPLTYTHTFFIRSKSPELAVDPITFSSPSRHLPRLMQRPKMPNRKSPYLFESDLKQRAVSPTPPRLIQPKKFLNKNSLNPTVKRVDIALPSLKYMNLNEKVTPTDQPIGTKIVNEYLQSKKLTEIITNPLPGTNNQINYTCGHSISPNLSKISPLSYHNDTYFFQNHTNDHFQPIIHSTH